MQWGRDFASGICCFGRLAFLFGTCCMSQPKAREQVNTGESFIYDGVDWGGAYCCVC
jgi:hypothetical protein